MADFSQNIVNQRFKEVYDYLENNNLIKGKSDIAKTRYLQSRNQ